MSHSTNALLATLLALPLIAGSGPVGTFEDLFGDTGNSFQGAIGFVNFEGTAANPASSSYGLAIDDMYVEWREFTREPDVTSCAAGSCAVVETSTTNIFQGDLWIPISVLDESPYGRACVGGTEDGSVCHAATPDECEGGGGVCLPTGNDCDLDGRFDGAGDDTDCNDNGIPDVIVHVTSEIDLEGVIVVCDREGPAAYACAVAVSRFLEGPETLLISGNQGDDPTVLVTYPDHDDGTGHPCQNAFLAENHGVVRAATTVFLPSCNLAVIDTDFMDNGDDDSFADTSETVEIAISVENRCPIDLTGCTARLATGSPWIECIQRPQISVGDVARGETVEVADRFRFTVSASTDRNLLGLSADDPLSAELSYRLSCNEIDSVEFPQGSSVTFDLNLSGLGQASSTWLEGFEGTTPLPGDLTGNLSGSAFTAENLDAGLPGNDNAEGLANADGWRCQYADPDWVNSGSYGQDSALNCYPGIDTGAAFGESSLAWWNASDNRAMFGVNSMHYGMEFTSGPLQGELTSPLAVVESAASSWINLGVDEPRLSFWHQVTLADHRLVAPVPAFRSADRGVVQIQLGDEAGEPTSAWMTLQPIQNPYDEQAMDNFFACTFDPVDDGTTEDDFYDPGDPTARLGPSSTCYPQFSYGYQGDTNCTFPTDCTYGNATAIPDPPLAPAHGEGAWVEVVADLEQYRGRRARLRFLVSAIKAASGIWEYQGHWNPDPREDGWFIDEVRVDDVLPDPAVLVNDAFTLGSCSGNGDPCIAQCGETLAPCSATEPCGPEEGECVLPCPFGEACTGAPPPCGPACSVVTASISVETAAGLATDPMSVATAAPGQVASFDGSASAADACASGVLQSRFCISGDPDGGGPGLPDDDCDDSADIVIRSWTENFRLAVAPGVPDRYVMEVRCSSAPSCMDAVALDLVVACPGAANALGLADLRATDSSTLSWAGAPLAVDLWTSDELALGELSGYPGSLSSAGTSTSTSLSGTPAPGRFRAYLVKAAGPLVASPDNESSYRCNSRTWRSGGTAEVPESGPFGAGRDASIGAP